MAHVSDWSKAKIFINKRFNDCVSLAKSNMHLHGALTVANIAHLLLGLAVDIGEYGWQIIVSHVLEGKFPKLLVLVRIVLSVVPGVFVASAIAQPHIVALVGQHKGGCLVLIINDPSVRRVDETVLEDDWLEALLDGTPLLLYSEHCEDIAVLGDDLVRLSRVIVVFAICQKLQLSLRVRTENSHYEQSQGKQDGLSLHHLFGDYLQQIQVWPLQQTNSKASYLLIQAQPQKSTQLNQIKGE